MDLRFLKKVRIAVSLLFLISITALFLDLSFTIQSGFSDYPLFLQLIPSLLNILTIGILAGIGFFVVLVLTLLFGRVYCSTICPLGILQDIIIYFRNKYKTVYFSLQKAWNKTRYSILAVTILLLIIGISFGINILDPYSNYGRIITNILRPAAIGLNNLASSIFEIFDSYLITPLEFKGFNLFSFFFSISVLFTIIILSVKGGRLFCNSICPVGTFLGLISKISFFKIGIIESNCIRCGECELVCKSNCIESESKYIDFSRCVGCFNCLDSCDSIAITYIPRYGSTESDEFNSGKRNFLKNIGVFVLGSNLVLRAQQKIIEVYKKNTVPVIRKSPVSPPGSVSLQNFNDNCTACHLCVSSCPTQVLQPSFLEYGLLNVMQPRMDYKTSFCNYECTVCSEVCPNGAIINKFPEEKKLIQIGKVNFIKDNCVVYTQKTDCGACAEHCPTKAVRMELDPEVNKKSPLITVEFCVGCGACEYACPTITYKAIYVEGNVVHQSAKKPLEEKLDDEIDYNEEFPF